MSKRLGLVIAFALGIGVGMAAMAGLRAVRTGGTESRGPKVVRTLRFAVDHSQEADCQTLSQERPDDIYTIVYRNDADAHTSAENGWLAAVKPFAKPPGAP